MNYKDLITQIEALRAKMILVGISKGLTAPDTLELSETLDQLLNLQMEIKGEEKFESNHN